MQDAGRVQERAGDRRVAATTAAIPHPYRDGIAEAWIAGHADAYRRHESVTYAVCVERGAPLLGCVSLCLSAEDEHGELGYRIGCPDWGRGLGRSAARALVAFAFVHLGLQRVFASVLPTNLASVKILRGLGMAHEGHLRQHVCKFGVRHDLDIYGMLRGEPRPSVDLVLQA